jgi:hypothetical protein
MATTLDEQITQLKNAIASMRRSSHLAEDSLHSNPN